MTLRVLADENIPGVESLLGAQASVRRFSGRTLHQADLDGVDALLVRSVTPVNGALLARSAVRFVGTATSGFDHVEREYLDAAGIGFAHAPGANANAVVEYVLAAIAAVDDHLERLLAGARVGIVGFGHVGRLLAGRLRALGAEVMASDPWLPRHVLAHSVDLPALLECDILSLHCSLTDASPWPSRHLVGRGELLQMRADSLLINASRGAVVDTSALRETLAAGEGPRCVLDVWEGEPAIDAALLARVRLGTAHIAGYSREGKWRATEALCRALREQFGLTPPSPAASAGRPETLSIPPGHTGASLVRHLIAARCAIERDDALLREAVLGAGQGAAREGFDRLRRHYEDRRELAGSRLIGADLSALDERLVRALGCVVNAPQHAP